MGQYGRAVIQLVIAIVVTSMLGGLVLTGITGVAPDQNTVSRFLPANTLAVVTAALSPSVSQKVSLAKLSQHLPPGSRATSASAVKDVLLSALFQDTDLNYQTDIKPWLGTEAAVVVEPPADGSNSPIVVGAIQTTNPMRAYSVLRAHNVDPQSMRFLKNYMFIVASAQLTQHSASLTLDAIGAVTNAGAPSLQSNVNYKSAIASLHGQHLLLGWADVPALTKLGVTAMGGVQVAPGAGLVAPGTGPVARPAAYEPDLGAHIVLAEQVNNGAGFVAPQDIVPAPNNATTVPANAGAQPMGTLTNTPNQNANAQAAPPAGQAATPDGTPAGGNNIGGQFARVFAFVQAIDPNILNNQALDRQLLGPLQEQADAMGDMAFELYAESSDLKLEALTRHPTSGNVGGTKHALLSSLPVDVNSAIDISQFGDLYRSTVGNMPAGIAPSPLMAATGELGTVLGDEGVVTTAGATNSNVAVVDTVTDMDKATNAVVQMAANVNADGYKSTDVVVAGGRGWEFAKGPSASYVAVANNRIAWGNDIDFVKSLLNADGKLGTKVLSSTRNVDGEVYLNLNTLLGIAGVNTSSVPLGLAGGQFWSDGGHDHLEMTFKLT